MKIFQTLKKKIQLRSFEQKLLKTKNDQEGTIEMLGNDFHYHHGKAFYVTYLEIFRKNLYEFKPLNNTPRIIDCGANMGLSVLYFAKKFPGAEIIAFEPDAAVLPFLEKNIKTYNLENVQLYKKAVWYEETELEFYTDKGLGGRVGEMYKDQIPVMVGAVDLGKFLNKPVDFLKIDIEGPEFYLLQNCQDLLGNVENLFVEYHSFYDEEQKLDNILNLLKKQGFRYHLQESFSRRKPFVEEYLINEKFDMAINIFAYKV